eukprot:TRINITY_DN450_c0_g1_i1.p2 TRINITY_DN450_c0_g1~~TRINITY_DN450_c0_g1_i1.p2  ORF type:complete len:480 (+),score=80.56 TRINITY_DN450_c0_g1_i1:522-1961(+)
MCFSDAPTPNEQPLVTVKDCRPSRRNSSSSSSAPPDSTDDDLFVFDPITPCPFADVPRRSSYGRLYTTRCSRGVHTERPVVTTLETPFPLRCWSINGPDESVHPDQLRPVVYEDEHVTVRMKDTDLLQSQWQLANMRPPNLGFTARVGNMSPLQRTCIQLVHPPRCVQPHPRRAAPFTLSKSRIMKVDAVLENATQLLYEPSCLSDSSEDSEHKLDFTVKSSSHSCHSSDINLCLESSSDKSIGSLDSQHEHGGCAESAPVMPAHAHQSSPPLEPEQMVTRSQQRVCSEDASSTSKQHLFALKRRVEQLSALTASLERELSARHDQNAQLRHQLRGLRDACSVSCTAAASARAGHTNVDGHTEASTKRRSFKRKLVLREEERLRVELMEEKKRTAQFRRENERLLGLILKLKCEMEAEHELVMSMEKKAMAGEGARRRQSSRYVMRRSASRGSRGKGDQRRFGLFARRKSHMTKKSEAR